VKKLTGPETKNLQDALLDAFPDQMDLSKMVRFQLEENLSEISEGGNLGDVVFALLEWARSRGRMEELIKGALAANPTNPLLKNFATDIGISIPAVSPRRTLTILKIVRRKINLWYAAGSFVIILVLAIAVIGPVRILNQMNDFITCQQTMTVRGLQDAGAYVRIESIDPSPETKVFSEGETTKVTVSVSYNLPGKSLYPTLQFRYLSNTEPVSTFRIIQKPRVQCGKRRLKMEGDVTAPKLSDLHGTPFQLVVALSVPDPVTGRESTVASETKEYQMRQAP
jgi:hypothetical protein